MAGLSKPAPLSDQDLSGFSCGNRALDAWLRKSALKAQQVNTAKVYVVCDGDRVVGYYALTTASIVRDAVPTKADVELPRHPVPGVLLARLAVDSSYQGLGVGKALVRDALMKSLAIQKIAGAVVLLVHSKDEKASEFYLSLGFERSPAMTELLCLHLSS